MQMYKLITIRSLFDTEHLHLFLTKHQIDKGLTLEHGIFSLFYKIV